MSVERSTGTAAALWEFYSGFGLPAYTVGTVPDSAQLPYITYSLVETEATESSTHYVQVWYRDTSNTALLATVDAIKEAIGQGVILDAGETQVTIRPGSPYVQLMVDEDPANRYAYINLQINCYHV